MSPPIVNPPIPFVGDIPGGLHPGVMCRIQGVTHPNADRFNVNLQTGPNAKPRDDTGLHLSVRLNQGYIARNSYNDGTWGDEQGDGILPIGQAQSFEIIILVDASDYKVAVNGQHFCEFPHRIPIENISNILIDGDVAVTLLSWEDATAPAETVAAAAAQLNAEGPQGGNLYPTLPDGFIPDGPPSGAPVGAPSAPAGAPYMGPPQGPPMGPPQGYGMPPPPPGAQATSQTDDFYSQAQTLLVGAIKSGAAQNLLKSLLSTGPDNNQQPQPQGYAHQNAQYGQYPGGVQPQVQQDQKGPLESLLSGFLSPAPQTGAPQGNQYANNPQQQQQAGPLEGLLSGFLSSSNQQNAAPQPGPRMNQVGGENSMGGLGSMGGLLSNLAGSLFNKQGGNQH